MQRTVVGVYGFGMLVHWSQSELDRAKSVRVSWPVPAPVD
jgi:hypothetical protein